jgi:hypothetical protein
MGWMVTWGTGVPRRERRSSRIPLELRLEIASTQTVGGWLPILANTTVVNLHGALVRTSKVLPKDRNVLMTLLSATNALVMARVVYSDPSDSLLFGIEFFTPRNIWGISDIPADGNLVGP